MSIEARPGVGGQALTVERISQSSTPARLTGEFNPVALPQAQLEIDSLITSLRDPQNAIFQPIQNDLNIMFGKPDEQIKANSQQALIKSNLANKYAVSPELAKAKLIKELINLDPRLEERVIAGILAWNFAPEETIHAES